MKKQYMKPAMQAYDIKMTQILCVSGDEPLGAPELFTDIDLDLE